MHIWREKKSCRMHGTCSVAGSGGMCRMLRTNTSSLSSINLSSSWRCSQSWNERHASAWRCVISAWKTSHKHDNKDLSHLQDLSSGTWLNTSNLLFYAQLSSMVISGWEWIQGTWSPPEVHVFSNQVSKSWTNTFVSLQHSMAQPRVNVVYHAQPRKFCYDKWSQTHTHAHTKTHKS